MFPVQLSIDKNKESQMNADKRRYSLHIVIFDRINRIDRNYYHIENIKFSAPIC
ncbi:MAG: hypothetical protein L6244_01475 [Candidatus Methanoperedenaceae archaeon]|nr:hypothetical protein [Candidatus Methanoperedenaceae archaeon]